MKIIDSHNYNIYFGEESIRFLPQIIASLQPTQIVFLYDENSEKHCRQLVDKILYSVRYLKQFDKDLIHSIVIPQGEQHKNIDTVLQISTQLLDYQMDRKSMMVCVGGGVVCDMGNFIASIWKRGIRCLLIPTTLLSMVDASCGSKTGINFHNYKNLIGTFSDPVAVICDPVFLKTLPQRELLSGFAEMLKHSVISGHIQDFYSLQTIDCETISKFIYDSLNIKNSIVLQDFKENHARKMLNFGHTIGHALEQFSLSTEKPLLHGEAVALGMQAESFLAHRLGQFDSKLFDMLSSIIDKHYAHCKFAIDKEVVLRNMLNDKKNLSGKIVISLPFLEKFIVLDAQKDKTTLLQALSIIG